MALRLGQRPDQVDMEMSESPLRCGEPLIRRLDMSADFAGLAVGALLAPGPDILLDIVPDEPVWHSTGRGDGPQVGQPADGIENFSPVLAWNQRAGNPGRNITEKSGIIHLDVLKHE